MSLPQATLALSSWAVHNWVGETFESTLAVPSASGRLGRILELPQEAKTRLNINTLEICHFHLVQDPKQLERLRSACVRSGTRLHQLLIDEGDITHPTNRFAWLEWIGGWIQAASSAGFERVRVIAGQQPAIPETIKNSIESLKMLRDMGKALNVAVSTENWLTLTEKPETVLEILDGVKDGLGLVLDFGNYTGPDKYSNLEKLAPRATSAHAKCNFNGGQPDVEDFKACIRILGSNNFKGVATLVHPEASDEWGALELQRALFLS